MFISNSPRLFAGNHVLLRLSVPRHSPYALFRLNSLACSLSRFRVTRSKFRSCLSFANNCLGCNEKTVLSNILHHCFHHRGFPRRRIVVPSFGKTFYCLPNYNYLFVSFLIRFSMNNPGLPCGIPRAQARTTLRIMRLCGSALAPIAFRLWVSLCASCIQSKKRLVGLIESRFAKTLMRSFGQSRIRLHGCWWA